MIYETDPQFFAYVFVADTFKMYYRQISSQTEVYNYIGRHLKYKIYV